MTAVRQAPRPDRPAHEPPSPPDTNAPAWAHIQTLAPFAAAVHQARTLKETTHA